MSQELELLFQNPRESLDTEIKQWIDPTKPEGIAKIAKACIALRNYNGGRLIIGLQDDGKPDPNVPPDVRVLFHSDKVQMIVGKFASESFQIEVEFHSHNGVEYPIIRVPAGVETPVAAKSDLANPTDPDTSLIKCDTVYVRTLKSNNTVSSSAARWKDWPEITRHCFDNREADIGAFIRRHLSNVNLGHLSEFVMPPKPTPTAGELATSFLDVGKRRFDEVKSQRHFQMPGCGTFEVAIAIDGDFPKQTPDENFYRQLQINKPNHTGWSFWLGDYARSSNDTSYVYDMGWESLFGNPFGSRGLDFWRAEPSGRFYHLRPLRDDLEEPNVPPKKYLDFALHISHVTEAVSIGSYFARALGCNESTTGIGFACRWTGLEGRNLYSWSEPGRSFHSRGAAVQDTITTQVAMPLETAPSAFTPVVESLVAPLFALFGGMRFETSVIESIVRKTLANRY